MWGIYAYELLLPPTAPEEKGGYEDEEGPDADDDARYRATTKTASTIGIIAGLWQSGGFRGAARLDGRCSVGLHAGLMVRFRNSNRVEGLRDSGVLDRTRRRDGRFARSR